MLWLQDQLLAMQAADLPKINCSFDSAPFCDSTPPPPKARWMHASQIAASGRRGCFLVPPQFIWELPSCEAALPFSCWRGQTLADLLLQSRSRTIITEFAEAVSRS
jgi:hypothetical protein